MTPRHVTTWEQVQKHDLNELLDQARELSWKNHGKVLQCFIPGQMGYLGERGQYPAISLTGNHCLLTCDHCGGTILKSMLPAVNPSELRKLCHRLDENDTIGILLSGGADAHGRLPWKHYLDAIRWIKHNTRLKISIHTGFVDQETASALADAGVDEALIDVIGSQETLQCVYHLPLTLQTMESSLSALIDAGMKVIPHIVLGLHYGMINGEMHALDVVTQYPIATLVIVVLQPLKGTAMHQVVPPTPETVARFIATARLRLPQVPLALSCARPLGNHQIETDRLALQAGINRIAMPSEEVVALAGTMGLAVEFFRTCCSKSW